MTSAKDVLPFFFIRKSGIIKVVISKSPSISNTVKGSETMSRSHRKKTYKTKTNKRLEDCIAGLECMKPCRRKRIPYRKAMECLNAFAERI